MERDTFLELQPPAENSSRNEAPVQNQLPSGDPNPVLTSEVPNCTTTSGPEVAIAATQKDNSSAPAILGKIQVPATHGEATHSISNASQGSEKAPAAVVPINHIYSMLGVTTMAEVESAIQWL